MDNEHSVDMSLFYFFFKAREIGECVGCKVNCALAKLTKLFLVEDIVASLKVS